MLCLMSEVYKITMIPSNNYWKMRVLSVSGKEINRAKDLFESLFPNLSDTQLNAEQNKQIQRVLLNAFRSAEDVKERAEAGLCLRCYVSHRIFMTCQSIPHIYNVGAEKLFSYTELLPYVLNDDGQALVILDSEGKNQHIWCHRNNTTQLIPRGGEFFTVRILQKYNPNLSSGESLDNWINRLTRQNEYLRSHLWELGLATPSNWGFLCKSIPRSLSKHISAEDREIIKTFQAVYRRDRLRAGQKGRCLEPTQSQLQEILVLLQQKNITISSQELVAHFKRIAEYLREDWRYKKIGTPETISLDVYFQNSELLPDIDSESEEIALENPQAICQDLFKQSLFEATKGGIQQRVEELKKSRGYNNYAHKFPEGLRLYYQENKSLGDIATDWGIEWSQARRIFALGKFLDIVQYQTEEIFLNKLLQLRDESEVKKFSNEPEYLKTVATEVREFTVSKAFKEAKSELMTQQKNSLFAQTIRKHLSDVNLVDTKK